MIQNNCKECPTHIAVYFHCGKNGHFANVCKSSHSINYVKSATKGNLHNRYITSASASFLTT